MERERDSGRPTVPNRETSIFQVLDTEGWRPVTYRPVMWRERVRKLERERLMENGLGRETIPEGGRGGDYWRVLLLQCL